MLSHALMKNDIYKLLLICCCMLSTLRTIQHQNFIKHLRHCLIKNDIPITLLTLPVTTAIKRSGRTMVSKRSYEKKKRDVASFLVMVVFVTFLPYGALTTSAINHLLFVFGNVCEKLAFVKSSNHDFSTDSRLLQPEQLIKDAKNANSGSSRSTKIECADVKITLALTREEINRFIEQCQALTLCIRFKLINIHHCLTLSFV